MHITLHKANKPIDVDTHFYTLRTKYYASLSRLLFSSKKPNNLISPQYPHIIYNTQIINITDLYNLAKHRVPN